MKFCALINPTPVSFHLERQVSNKIGDIITNFDRQTNTTEADLKDENAYEGVT